MDNDNLSEDTKPVKVWSEKQLKVQEKILEFLKLGLADANASKAAGVSRVTLWQWQKASPQFAEQCEMARSEGVAKYAQLLKDSAEKGNPSSIQYFLSRRSEEFKENQMDKKTEEALQKLLVWISNNDTFGLLPPKQELSEVKVNESGIVDNG